jgi:hypothetical protein
LPGIPTITNLGLPVASTATDARSARPHSSNHTALHACHCGQTQLTRSDPFSLADALSFFDAPCCDALQHWPVPLLAHSSADTAPTGAAQVLAAVEGAVAEGAAAGDAPAESATDGGLGRAVDVGAAVDISADVAPRAADATELTPPMKIEPAARSSSRAVSEARLTLLGR